MPTRLCLLALLLLAALAAWPQGKPAVLFLTGTVTERPPGATATLDKHYFLPDPTLQAKLADAGFTWTAENFSTKLTMAYLRQFNAVVLLDVPIIEQADAVKDEVRAAEALLLRYVGDGGGLLVTGGGSMWGLERNIEEMNRMLAGDGATVLSEQIIEKNPAYTVPSLGAGSLAWTGNVQPHPLTADVRGLLYPTDFAWTYYTHPLKLSSDWQVLLKASPTATTITVKLGAGGDQTRRPGAAPAEPPMVAVRQRGKGRLAIWPMTPSTFIIDAYHRFWGGGLIMDGTNPALPSDGRALLFNLLQWLAAPSRGTFGGYAPKPTDVIANTDPRTQPVDWDKVTYGGKRFPHAYRGLIGLRSTLSTGAAEPRAMIQAARDAGYQFAAFSEELEKLTADKLEALKALCLAESSTTFQVFPGFTYHDDSGNAWATFGRTLAWPKDDWWSSKQPGALVKNNIVFRGYAFPPVILFNAGGYHEPAWFQGNFKGMALFTSNGGMLVDNAFKLYLKLQEDGFDLFPAVVHLVRTPAEIITAAKLPYQSYTGWYDLPDIMSAYSGTTAMRQSHYVFHRPQFISGGPVIDDFTVIGFGTADLATPNNDRYRLCLMLSAPKGLKEVAIYDGQELYRRILLNGEKEWTGTIEGYQDRNRVFLAVVTDLAGNKAVSGGRWTNVQELLLVRCTDNLNTYPSGKFLGTNVFPMRGLESYIDRQAGQFSYFPNLGLPETERPAVEQQLTQVSRFGYIRDDVQDYGYPPTASANWNQTDQADRAEPRALLRGHTVTTLFTPRADGTVVYLVEGDFAAKQDIILPQERITVYAGTWTAEADTAYLSRRNGTSFAAKLCPRLPYCFGTMDAIEYAANLGAPGGSRAVYPLLPGTSYGFIQGSTGHVAQFLYHDVPEKRLPAGAQLRYRYLAAWGTVNGPPSNAFMEEVCDRLGLRGVPAYTVKATQGRVVDTRFVLHLQAANYGFAGTVSQAKLPIDLPVFIDGLNPRWPAGILYKGKNTLMTPVWRFTPVGDRYVERVPFPGENQLLRFGIRGDRGMLQIDTEHAARDLYIGNLLVCDHPEVFLQLDDARPGKVAISANNPTDAPLTCTITPGPGFTLLGNFTRTITLPPGGIQRIALP